MQPAHFCLYVFLRLGEAAMRLFPLSWVFAAGRCTGALAHMLLWKRRRLALLNLTLAFGKEKTDGELRVLAREHFRTLCANLFSCLKLATMRQEEIWKRITLEKPEALTIPPEPQRTGWIAMISHIGNWELFSHLAPMLPEYRLSAIYQRLANPFIDRHLRRSRAHWGIKLFDRREGYLRSVAFLRAGGVVGVLVDQFAGYAGLWTPFFGRLASCSPLAATLSTRTGLPVVPIAIYTAGLARWRVVVSEPIHPEIDHAEGVELLTARIHRQLEEQIAQSPGDWLWSHNRWKPLRPHFLFTHDQRRFFFPQDFDRATLEPFRVLIRSPNIKAEAAASLPAIRAVKKGRPDTWLAILTPGSLADFWRTIPQVDLVIATGRGESVRSTFRKIKRAGRFDAAVVFADSPRAALEVFFAAIPLRAGPRARFTRCFFNQHFPANQETTDGVSYYLKAAQSIGADINRPEV